MYSSFRWRKARYHVVSKGQDASATRVDAYLGSPVLGSALRRRELAPALALLGHLGRLRLAHLVLGAGNGRVDGVLLRTAVGKLLERLRRIGGLSSASSEEVFP
jgi:hypothetical protein